MTLRVKKEVLADLTPAELSRVGGGQASGLPECSLPTTDTTIVRDTLLDCLTGRRAGR